MSRVNVAAARASPSTKPRSKSVRDAAAGVPTGFRVFRRIGYFLAVIWLGLGVSLIALVLLDGVLKAALKGPKSNKVEAGVPMLARAAMPAVLDQPGYWLEHDQARDLQWRSYLYFRRLPFAGDYINVDAHGFRRTPQNDAVNGNLWLFGGSTIWGTGVDDAHTVASALSRAGAIGVGNFGESGYVSTQSQLSFLMALRCNAALPDAAIFVDGVNDVYSAVQSGRAGLPQNESNRVAEFNLSRSAKAVGNALISRLEGFQRLQQRRSGASAVTEVEPLAQAIVQHYLAVVAQTRAIAVARKIPVLFVWQPSLFERANPTSDERGVIANSESLHYALQRASTRLLRERLTDSALADVVILSDLFDAHAEPLYFDYSHTGARGNQIMADALWQLIAPKLSQRSELAPESNCMDLPVLLSASARP